MLISAILKEKGGEVVSVANDVTIIDVAQVLRKHRIGAVLVLNSDETIEGVLSERDIVRGLCTHGPEVLAKRAHDLMTRDVITCSPDHDIRGAMSLMTERRIRHLPILSDGKLIGLISIGDLVKYRILEAEQEAEALRGYIATG